MDESFEFDEPVEESSQSNGSDHDEDHDVLLSSRSDDIHSSFMNKKNYNLDSSEVHSIFLRAKTSAPEKLNSLPPVKPNGGDIYFYNLGSDVLQYDARKKQLRCDQYRWVHKGTHPVKHQSVKIMKKTSMIDLEEAPQGDRKFYRYEYWGIDSFFMLHYVGNCHIFQGFQHRNSTKTKRPFIRSAPCVKEEITKEEVSMSTRKIYQKLVNKSTGGPRHSIDTPRDHTQVRNFRKEIAREQRISHDSFFNIYQLCFQLFMNNRKGDKEDFIRYLSFHPKILVHMLAQPLLDTVELLLRVSADLIILHYDTVFNIGDYYLSTLLFRHTMFRKDPLIPIGFFLHSRRFHDDHIRFLTAVRKSVSLLATKGVCIVTDQEFSFAHIFPNSSHIFCWNHLEQDLIHYLKGTANCKSSEISYYTNVFKELMLETTEVKFELTWSNHSQSKQFSTNSKVLNYFEKTLIPVFKTHSSIWVLRRAGIANPEKGITNNPSESFNSVLHSLKQWKQVPLDVICISLFHLSTYYHRELERAFHQCGSMQLKEEFSFYQRDPSLMPLMPRTVEPNDIVARAKGELLPMAIQDDDGNDIETMLPKTKSQLGLAHDAVANKWVTLAYPGCWIVRGTDGVTPYTVTIHPRQSCSCSNSNCYHIMACKIMAGEDIEGAQKANASLLHQNRRKANKEKPSGRKKPRRNDFNDVNTSKDLAHDRQTDQELPSAAKDCNIKEKMTRKKRPLDTESDLDDNDFVDEAIEKAKRHKQVHSEYSTVPKTKVSCSLKKKNIKHNADDTTLLKESNNIDPKIQCCFKGTIGYTDKIVNTRLSNVKTNRACVLSKNEDELVQWEHFLKCCAINFPGKLLCPYVCQVNVDKEITNLSEGKIVILETQRSKQIAMLRRMDDDNDVPKVQCISVYASPDIQELEYHASTATRSNSRLVYVEHCGVELTDVYPDELTATLCIMACQDPTQDLSLIHVDPEVAGKTICDIVKSRPFANIPVDVTDESFFQPSVSTVRLLCLCLTAWIDGSTSSAIYGEKQKKFNVHCCSKCNVWYHTFCLELCRFTVPKRTQVFVCPGCTVPETIAWHHRHYTNTCTVDNVLTIILLHCLQNPSFLESIIGNSDIEQVIKGSVQLMLNGQINEGKSTILNYISARIETTFAGSKIDFKGNEYDMFLCFLKDISRVFVKQRCLSPHCPQKDDHERLFYSYSFSSSNTDQHLSENFPLPDQITHGYCAAEFKSGVPNECDLYRLNNRVIINKNDGSKKKNDYYECTGKVKVMESRFTNTNPWFLPISILNLQGLEIMQIAKVIIVYGRRFVLRGCTLYLDDHFTAVIYWHNRPFYYDGLGRTREQRFSPLKNDYLLNKTGGFACYILEI